MPSTIEIQTRELESDAATAHEVESLMFDAASARLRSISPTELRQLADPTNPNFLESQRRLLREHAGECLGAYVGSSLVAFGQMRDWTEHDQAPFGGKVSYRMRRSVMDIGALSNFVVKPGENFVARPFLQTLLAMRAAGYSQLRASVDDEDELTQAVLKDAGAQMRAVGVVNNRMRQLYTLGRSEINGIRS